MTAALSHESGSRTDSNCGCREAIAQLQAGQARLEASQAQIAAKLEVLIALVNMNHTPTTDTAVLPNSTDVSSGAAGHRPGEEHHSCDVPSPLDEQPRHKPPPVDDSRPFNPEEPWSYHKKTDPADVPVRLLPQLVQLANSEDPKDQFQGTLLIRKLLCVLENPPLDQVVESQVVPRLISFMLRDEFVDLQLNAAWAVANIISGGAVHISYVMEQGAVPHFIRLLNSPSEEVREQATWALGNIAGESATCRDYILGHGVMAPLLQCITSPTDNVSVTRNGVWAVSNLCRSKPSPDLDTVCQALPVVVPLLTHDDEEVVKNACWVLAFLSDGLPARVERVLNTGALSQITALLTSADASQQAPVIRIVGNIAAGDDEQTQLLVSSGALSSFHVLLNHPSRTIKKEACWVLSNITAGTPEQIQAVINAELFPAILECVGAVEDEIKKEAVWCVANLATAGTQEQIRYVVEELNVFNGLVQVLALYDSKILKVALDALQNLLQAGEGEKERRGVAKNPYVQMIVDDRGVSHLDNLESHSNNDVYFAAMNIIDTFFGDDES